MATVTEKPINDATTDQGTKSLEGFSTEVMREPNRFWAIFWGVAGLSLLPFMIPYGLTLMRQELYQYFPFVLLGVGYLVFIRWDRTVRGPSSRVSKALVVAGLGFIILAAAIHSTWLGNLSFVCFATAFLVSQRALGGGSLAYLALPLVMLIRIPQLHSQSLVSRLQKVTSQLSHLALDLMSVPHDAFANRLRLPGKELFVAEACSGIQSAFTMCFLALLIIVWRQRSVLLAPIYIVFALVFAVLANTIRVTIIALAEAWYGADWTTGWTHDAVGYFSLAIAAGTLWSFDHLCTTVFHPVEPLMSKGRANPLATAWNWFLGVKTQTYAVAGYEWEAEDGKQDQKAEVVQIPQVEHPRRMFVIGGLTMCCGLVMLTGMAFGRSDFRPVAAKDALLFDPPPNLLGDRIGVLSVGDHEVVRNGTDPQLGLHADVWRCASPESAGQFVMSQPYVGWHELCVCYEVQEWVLDKRYNMPVPDGKPIAVGEFSKGEDLKGYLFFSAIDSDGNVPTPPSYTLFGRIFAPFIPLITDDYAETSGSAQTVMVQMWTVSPEALDETQLIEIAKSVAEARDLARKSLVQHQQQLLVKQI